MPSTNFLFMTHTFIQTNAHIQTERANQTENTNRYFSFLFTSWKPNITRMRFGFGWFRCSLYFVSFRLCHRLTKHFFLSRSFILKTSSFVFVGDFVSFVNKKKKKKNCMNVRAISFRLSSKYIIFIVALSFAQAKAKPFGFFYEFSYSFPLFSIAFFLSDNWISVFRFTCFSSMLCDFDLHIQWVTMKCYRTLQMPVNLTKSMKKVNTTWRR